MFARPKINQLLANFKKKPVQTKQIPLQKLTIIQIRLNFWSNSPITIDFLSLRYANY